MPYACRPSGLGALHVLEISVPLQSRRLRHSASHHLAQLPTPCEKPAAFLNQRPRAMVRGRRFINLLLPAPCRPFPPSSGGVPGRYRAKPWSRGHCSTLQRGAGAGCRSRGEHAPSGSRCRARCAAIGFGGTEGGGSAAREGRQGPAKRLSEPSAASPAGRLRNLFFSCVLESNRAGSLASSLLCSELLSLPSRCASLQL